MSDIFREVDEDLRHEQYKKLWDRYGKYLIAVAVAIVLAVGGYQGWTAWHAQQRIDASDSYAAALELADTGGLAAAQDALTALADADSGGYGVLAQFEEARLKAQSGDVSGAIALWDRIAESSDADPAFRGIATLLSVMRQIDDGDPGTLMARLEPVMIEGNAFRPTALELAALLALRQGDAARARELFTMIADDPNAPATVRARAARLLDSLRE